MRGMNILVVCHRVPFPPNRGGKIRPFNIIRHLSQANRVTVASLARSAGEAAEADGLRNHCEALLVETLDENTQFVRMLSRLPSAVPSSMGYFYSRRLAARIRERLSRDRFDLIIVHCSSVAPYVENINGAAKLLDFGDMDSHKWLDYSRVRNFPLSTGYYVEGKKLKRAEISLARKFDFCTCTTRAELETLRTYPVSTSNGWFPNGVDLEYFSFSSENYDSDEICFTGRMDYFPNQQAMAFFCKDVLPLVQHEHPAARLTIVGANPSAVVRELGRLAGVSVTGSVPDVRPYLRKSAVTVAPLLVARGTQNKILESLASGTPVVASPEAAKGVDVVAGEHLLVGASPQELANQVLRLLRDPSLRHRLSLAGRARVETAHAWANSMTTLDGLIEECLACYHGQRERARA